MRIALLWIFTISVGIYAFRDWYKSLCGLILLMAVVEHPDMPNSIMGFQGLNPWNVLLLFVLAGWQNQRKHEGLTWDMPRHINILLILYFTVIIIGFFRMITDTGGLIKYALIMGSIDLPSMQSLTSEHFINALKWVIPGLLLYHGCNSRSRFLLAVFSVIGIYFLLAVQVIRWMPLNAITDSGSLDSRAAKILLSEVGYHRVNLSMMFSGAFWAILATASFVNRKDHALLLTLTSLGVLFAQALTGGRTGYATWAMVGIVIAFIRWRKYLILIPLFAAIMLWIVPGVSGRIGKGFSDESTDYSTRLESSEHFAGNYALYTITSGRSVAWPHIIDKIVESPLIGYGQQAMQRTGIAADLWENLGESFPHPHNAYFQCLLDNGLIGFIPIIVFYILVIKYSISLLKDTRNPVFVAIGGITFSFVAALLIASIGSQTFYPREGAVGMWCAIGLMLRVFKERSKVDSAYNAI